MAKVYFPLTLTLLAALLAGLATGTDPGFKSIITTKGLDYVRQVGIPILEATLSTLSIPDVSGHAGTPIGSVDYSLSKIKLEKVDIPKSSLTVSSTGVKVQASDIAIKVKADWRYRQRSWPDIKDHGSCDLSVSSVSLSVGVVVGMDSKGHPTLKASGCSLHIGHLDVHFHGGSSWLYNLFADSVADNLKGSIIHEVCKATEDEINSDGNKALESVPVVEKIDEVSEIDYTLVSAPKCTSSYFETNHKGEFFSISNHEEAPFTPNPLPAMNDTGKMMYVWLTEYLADTAGFVYQQAGELNYNVTPDKIPKGFVFQLNTASFKALIPQLYNAYPNMPVVLGLETVKPPNLDITPTSANFTIPGQVKVYVQDTNKNNTKVLAFILGAIVYADVKVRVNSVSNQEVVSANLTYLRAILSLTQSNIGQFSVTVLQSAFDLLCSTFAIPALNVYANKGIPIPVVEGISFVDPEIKFGMGYVLVGTNFNYKPTSDLKINVVDKDYL